MTGSRRREHAATYLLYFVMLMNVFITTFGISGGKHDTVIAVPRPAADMVAAAAASAAATSGHVTAALTSSTMSTPPTMRYDGKYDVIISDHSSIGNASYLSLLD